MAGLKIGQIDDGFRYKGGDPSSQDSWEQADALKPGDIDGDYQFSGGEPSSSENWKPITAKSAGVIETIKQAGLGLAGKYSEGSGNSLSGVGRFLQAPAASALELLTGLGAAVSDEDHKPGRQALARDVSQFAQESRDENVANGNAFSVAGKGMEGVGQDAQRYWKQKTEEAAPIVTQQERNFSDAKGFVDSTKAAISNPLGVLGGVAQSMPDMVVGMGTASAAGKLAKKMATQEAMVAAEAAGKSAAVEAAAVPGATEASVAEAVQTARQTTFDTVRRDAAVRAATPAGSASEAAQSGMSTQAQVHEFVLQQPADLLYANNDYFRQMIDGGMQEAEAKQRLANSLSAEASGLAAIATRAGSAVTGGGVATAKTIVGGERMTGKELLKRTGQDTAEEAVQGIGEEYSQYRAQKQADPKQEYDFGGTVAKNAISGLVMGAGGHGTGYVTERLEQRGNPDGQTPMPGKEIAPVAETTKTKTADPKPASADDFVRIGELDSIAEERTLTAAEQQEYQSLLTKFNEADHGQLPTTTNAEVAAPGNAGAGNGLPGSGNVLGAVPNGNADNSNLSAGVAEAGMRPAESTGNTSAPSLTYPAQQINTSVLDQKPVELAMPKLSPEHVEKVTAIDSRIDEIKAEIPTRTKAVQGSLQREADKLAKEKALIVDQAHAAEGADPELMAQYNAAKQAGNNDEMRRLAHEINGQKKKEPAKAEAPKGEQVLSLGTMPNNAEPITVKNGIVYVGSYPAQDYDSGDDVTVPNGATPQQIRNALAKAGAIARGQKVFGLPAEEKAPKQPKAARDKIDASKDSLFVAIAKLGGMDTQELLTNGFDRNDITQETSGRVSKKGKNAGKLGKKSRKPIAMGFALPLHKNGGMSFDGVLEALKQYGYFAEDATKNDAIDAFRAELGGDKHMTPDALMQQAEQDQAERDAMMAAEQARIDTENAAEDAAKEESGYDDLSEEAQDIADDFGDIDNPANAKTGEDAMRAFGFTEDEINEQVRQGGESGTESVAGESSDAAGSRAETDRAGGGQDGQSQEKVPEGAKPVAGNEEGGKGRRTEVGGFEQGRVGMKLAAGQIVLTASGRETTPFPKFQSSTGKMNKSHLAAVDAWLLKNAEQEAVLRGDTFNSRQFERDHYDAVNRKTVPQASKDAAEEYLFGQQPADVPSILKSLVPDQNGGFTLAGQTPAEVKAQEAKRKSDEESAAKAAREPAGPTVKVDLFNTQGGLVNSNRDEPKGEKKAAPENVNTASWIIRDRATGAVIMETFDRKKVDALNMEKYEAIPIQKHLAGINKDIKAGEETKKVEPTQAPAEKIEDFGQKIGGARKDVWTSFKDSLNEVSDDEVINQPFSKVWPEPDYQKMIDDGSDAWSVGFMRAARDEVPRKPTSSWKKKNWAEQVKLLRKTSLGLLDGTLPKARAQELLKEQAGKSPGMRKLQSRIELYQLVGHSKSLAGISFDEHYYSIYKGKDNVHLWVVSQDAKASAFSNWPKELATGATKDEALQKFKDQYATLETGPAKKPAVSFDIYSRKDGGFWIGKKLGRNPLFVAGPFKTVAEARSYRDANNAELVAKLDKNKEIPKERRDTNNPRVGEDMRNGQDVTPMMFGEAFGFKGVEFGNWVEQKKRQKDLNDAFDALMDMAAVLGVPPKAISLNGELGLAFGARGSGGVGAAAAHYEPGKIVINLTKKEGAGSLGHEWWHALDNYFQRLRGKGEYATEALDVSLAARGSPFVANTAMRGEMVEAFGAVVRSIKETALKARSSKLDAKRSKEYWTTGREMAARAFESYLISKLQDQNASNDYLANIVDDETWAAAEKLGFELEGSYPYPTAGEMPGIRAGFDKFFQTVEHKETDRGTAMFSRTTQGDWYYSNLSRQIEAAPDKVFGPAKQVKAWLQSNVGKLGIKADEIQWTGINDWLDMQTGKVSKADVLAYLDANGVQVQEVVKGVPSDKQDEYDRRRDEITDLRDRGGRISDHEANRRLRSLREELGFDEYGRPVSETKYAQYALPGGENYRELLLTLPEKHTYPQTPVLTRAEQKRMAELGQKMMREGNLPSVEMSEWRKYKDQQNAYQQELDVLSAKGKNQNPFRSLHWEEANILAHIRFNDRTDAGGNKVLFIEEIQSDWGQKGKKEGFGGGNHKSGDKFNVVRNNETVQVTAYKDTLPNGVTPVETASGDRFSVTSTEGVLPAPFVTDTKSWVALAVKRMIAHAAQNGYDKVAFVTGEQSADRYDLSKQVDSVEWTDWPAAGKDHGILVARKNGDEVIKKTVPSSELESLVGKDVARNLLAAKPDMAGRRTIEGDGLKVGGSGMKSFYDAIVPQVVNDVLKKVGGGKVETVAIPNPERPSASGNTLEESSRNLEIAKANWRATLEQPGFTITPEMREKAGSGLPLFARRNLPGRINLQDLDAVAGSMSREFPGVPIITVEDERQLPKALREEIKKADASGDVSGVFHAGKIYLIQSNINDIEDAQARAVHEVVHAGLSAMGVSDETFLNIGVSNPKLHSEARKIKAKYGYSFVTSIEEAMADMGPAARKLAGWKRIIANVRAKLRKLGFVRQWTDNDVEFLVLRALRAMKKKDAAVVSDKAMYSGVQQLRRKLTKDDTKMSALLTMLAEHDALFQQQAAFSDTPEEIGKEIDPSYPVKEQGPSSARAKGVDRIWEIGVPSSGTRSAYMMQKGNKVWLDLQRLLPGIDAGNKIYGIAAGYAHNTGRVLVGDPDGLSRMAFYRRTESMISSILKYGTSDHLEPHYAQTNPAGYYYDNGEAEFGKSVRAIDWEEGNTARNLRELIYTAYQGAIQNAPEIKDVYYDFDRHTFVQARPGTAPVSLAESYFTELSDRVSNRKGNPYRAGSATLKRAALVNTLVRRAGEAGREDVAENGSQLRRAAAAWAASNSGLDPELRKIFYSRTGQTPDAALPEESKTEKARRVGQDKFLRFKVVQDWLKAQGVNVSDLSNVYRAETLMHGRVSTRIEDFREKQLQPLIQRIQKAGFTLPEIAEYLEAKHTPEANQKQREIHKDPEATAAGVTDADALAVVKKWQENPKFAEFEKMADEVRSISDQTRDMLVKAGILSQEMAEAWQKAYQHYVPLKGGAVDPSAKIGAGPGLSVKAKQKRRLGHGQRDEFIIENIIAAHEKAIRQVEKNRVGRTLALFLNEANNDEIGTISKPAKRQVLKETAAYEVLYHGTVVETFHNLQDARDYASYESGRSGRDSSDFKVTKSVDPIVVLMASPMLAENEAVYYLHGKEIRMQLNDENLARAYKNLGVEDLGKFLSIGRDVNSWLSKAYTGYNPEFLLVNIVRDFSTGIINMTGDLGAGFAAKVVKNYPVAMKALWKSKDGDYTQLIKEYRDDGGSTGAAYLSDLERVGNDLQRAYDDARGVKATWAAGRKLGSGRVALDKSISWVMTYVEHLNRVGENAMRVALYKTMREAGKPRTEAAEAAKNVTVNFNRKGEIASQAGALYLFFNPNVQGTAKLLETMLSSPHKKQAWALLGGMVGLAFLLANLGRGDDEDEWRNIPSHVKDRNLVFKVFGKQITLPVPYGYGFFHMIGNAMSDLTHGVDFGKVAMNLTSGFFEHFSPVGNPFAGDEANSKNLVQLLPTLARIPGEIAVNRNGMGGPISPEKPEWDKHKPDSQTLFRSTKGGFLAGTAEAMNSATGGTKYESGAIDVSPETLKYLIRTFAGGTGTFFGDAIGLGIRGAQGAAPEFREIPVVRKFVREESIQDVRRRYYEATDEAKKATNELAAARRNHDADGAQNIIAEKRELIAMGRVADKMRKSVSAQRDAQDRIMQDDDLSLPEKRSRVKALENEEAQLYNRYLKLFQEKEVERSERKKAVNQ